MVSAEAIVRGNEKTLKMCEFEEIERPIVIQLFGGQPQVITEAARKILEKGSLHSASRELGLGRDDIGVDGIDVNMGCPVKKVTKTALK